MPINLYDCHPGFRTGVCKESVVKFQAVIRAIIDAFVTRRMSHMKLMGAHVTTLTSVVHAKMIY